jgi:hypothetical protein
MMGSETRPLNGLLESRLEQDHVMRRDGAASTVQPAESDSKQGPNTTTPSRAEPLLAAERRTLEMMANGASLSEVLTDLCAAIDAHSPPATSMVCLMDPDRKQLLACAAPSSLCLKPFPNEHVSA